MPKTGNDDTLVQIRQQTGNFILNKPNKTTTEVHVSIEKYDFDHTFTFDEDFWDVTGIPWDQAIDNVAHGSVRNIGDRDPQEDLRDILYEHEEEIHEAWKEYREDEIEEEIESLKEEKALL